MIWRVGIFNVLVQMVTPATTHVEAYSISLLNSVRTLVMPTVTVEEMMDMKDLFETKAKGRSDGKAKEKILVLIPETTFVGVESRVLIPETTVWDTLVYPSDTLVILRAFAISPLVLRGSIRGYMKDLFETKAKGRSDGKAKEKILVLIPETTFVGVESRVLIPETTFVGVESRVLIPETTFVGVESRVLIPETTFVGVESRVLIPETTVWDTLVYPSDTLVIRKQKLE
ncbi:hypothetical protein Tco_0850043 [Tanacetum coccineum]